MNSRPIILIGSGGHAESCIDVIEQEGQYTISGLVGFANEVGTSVLGYPVIGSDDDLPQLVTQFTDFIITVGHIENPETRIRLFEKLVGLGGGFPTIVSPRAYVSRHASIGTGSIIMHGAIINSGARVGNNCIINSLALIEHGVSVDDHCHISTAAVVNGSVSIGSGTFVGSGSKIRQCLNVGANSLIGMGQNVVVDCPDGARLPVRKIVI